METILELAVERINATEIEYEQLKLLAGPGSQNRVLPLYHKER